MNKIVEIVTSLMQLHLNEVSQPTEKKGRFLHFLDRSRIDQLRNLEQTS